MTALEFQITVMEEIRRKIKRAQESQEHQRAFSEWIDQHNDGLPEAQSFSEWLQQTGDSV